jgi:sugar/nucleoside kinase (ribokinase family)
MIKRDNTRHRILCIGDIALDVIVKLEIEGGEGALAGLRYGSDTPSQVITRGGGTAANVASWLATTDVKPELLARVGDDSVGSALVAELVAAGVECHVRTISDLATGTVVVLVDRSGERTMFPDSGANAGLSARDLPSLTNVEIAYISGYALFNRRSHQGVLDIFEVLEQAEIPVIFDPASVGTMSTFADHYAIVSILTKLPNRTVMILNESEARYLAASESAPLEEILVTLTRNAEIVVIKRNESGAVAIDAKSGGIVSDRQPRREPVDTTGAGDSFAAGFMAEWIKNRDLLASLKSGNEMAGRCVQVIGARPLKSP